jgi:WD40 repeat protein
MPKKPQVKEDWKSLRTWRGHRRTISDITWSPDSIHFVSCGTDSTICVWNVNEHCKYKLSLLIFVFIAPLTVIQAKANGLTFDPFGKFIASQSSEERKLTIWRVQNYKNITKEAEHELYYKN